MEVDEERMREIEEDERGGLMVWTDEGWWVAAEIREIVDDGEPEKYDVSGWEDSRVYVEMYAPTAGPGWAGGNAVLICDSEDGEWGDARLEYHTTEIENRADPYSGTDESVGVSRVEEVSWSVVNGECEILLEEMERALRALTSTGTYTRAVLAASVVRSSARRGRDKVWATYAMTADEPSISGYVEWMGEPELSELLDQLGADMWPVRCESWDVSRRVLQRSLKTMEYFAADWTTVLSSSSDDENDVADESDDDEEDDDEDDEVGEVTFEPADG